eukprot:SAG31_NODE_37283_length_305_cov_1.320388_1_plen_35_part_10
MGVIGIKLGSIGIKSIRALQPAKTLHRETVVYPSV